MSLLSMVLTSTLACAPLASTAVGNSPATGGKIAYRIAVAPVTLSPEVERRRADAPTRYADAATNVGHYLVEALLERGIEVMPARDSRGTLAALTRSPDLHHDASRLTRVAVEHLGVDALLLVELKRWTPLDKRQQRPSPAAVAFRATLHGGSEGLLLWSGEFSERQVPFFESPWRSLRYPGRGTRWLSTEELARWGSRKVAQQIPVATVER